MSLSLILASSAQIQNVSPIVIDFVKSILKDRRPIGVIYYGSTLWKQDLSGLLDFYIVCENLHEWYGNRQVIRIVNELLPPNIEYHEYNKGKVSLRAKVAILSLEQLKKATTPRSIDTTMWARFCQPVKIIWSKDTDAQKKLLSCLSQAVETASWWAAYLGPHEGTSEDYWCNLFGHTYGAELRVESKNRPMSILENREVYFKELIIAGWEKLGIPLHRTKQNYFILEISKKNREKAYKQWRLRQNLGRPINILRLIKAAFTFQGGADYVSWKIKRHKGIDLSLNSFQKKHPILNAPWILFRLFRQGVFRR